MSIDTIMLKARRGDGMYRWVRPAWRRVLAFRLPVIRPVAAFLYAERGLRVTLWALLLKMIYREPLLRYRCARVGHRLNIEAAIPLIYGNGRIELGDDVIIGGRNTWTIGMKTSTDAALIVGSRVTIGYQNTISVAQRVEIGDDTMLAPNVQIYDNTNHPLSPARRLRHEPISLDEAAAVSIGRNVWIGTGAIIMRGVTIGDNAVVGAASVVTKSVPPNTLVAGNPARIIKQLSEEAAQRSLEQGA